MRYFVTGHTGFKGAWLCVMLKALGHEVIGFSIDVPSGGLFEKAQISNRLEGDFRGDIRQIETLKAALLRAQPDVVVHLAAQSLVRASYDAPRLTFETNSTGTVNLLESMHQVCPDAILLAVTTDKVYKNVDKKEGYLETDELGGHDPYSASKAMADLALQSWSASFPDSPRLVIARAGNVIGPFDVSEDRLLPDVMRAYRSGSKLFIRQPEATRPWQYVLDCLAGYLALVGKGEHTFSGAWNFGPLPTHEKTVLQVLGVASEVVNFSYEVDATPLSARPEQKTLTLNSQHARTALGWRDTLSFKDSVRTTIELEIKLSNLSPDEVWRNAQEHSRKFSGII